MDRLKGTGTGSRAARLTKEDKAGNVEKESGQGQDNHLSHSRVKFTLLHKDNKRFNLLYCVG
jgi:hypothetical protein